MTDQDMSQALRPWFERIAQAPAVDASATSEFNVAAHGLRGIASIMVMIAHVIGGTARHVYSADPIYVAAAAHPWNLGVFGVKLFFLISGFVILPSALRYTPGEFALRRFLRIYPLFLVASIFFIVLNGLTNLYPGLNSAGTIVSALLFINLFTGTEQLTPNAWSLSYEVVFYVLTAACVWVVVHRTPIAIAAAVAAAAIGFLLTFPVSLFFILGCLVRLVGSKMMRTTISLRLLEAAALVSMVIAASGGFFEYRLSELANPYALGALCSAAVFFWLAVDPRSISTVLLGNRVLAYFGTISYSMYLVHPYVYFVVRAAFQRLHLFTPNALVSVVLFGLIVALLSTAASHVAHKALEQWPYRRFFRQRIFHARTSERVIT